MLKVLNDDKWLISMESDMCRRYNNYVTAMRYIDSLGGIVSYAEAYNYYGFQYDKNEKGWWFREWLPEAYEVFLMGDFNDWCYTTLPLQKNDKGVWSVFMPDNLYKGRIVNGTRYKLYVHGKNGFHQRVSAYSRLMIQDPDTKDFTPIIYTGDDFDWEDDNKRSVRSEHPIIYEAHVGMSGEEAKISTYASFQRDILPRIVDGGYNTIQFMALAEHPYYGSYGYHVSNLFAPTSSMGTPSELKSLIREAHKNGIAVVMDLVHSHYVKNLNESISHLDGSNSCYSPLPPRDYQPYWDSYLYDYSKEEVQRYLLSNIKYWIDEFHIDGFRFDGVTSMLYHNHGYQEFSNGVKDYIGENINYNALLYLTLANKLIKTLGCDYFSIAEDVSGMPGLCHKPDDGGVGFDYRLGMSQPDYWIKLLEEQNWQWNMEWLWNEMNNRLPWVRTIAYCESHDQLLQGDKTIAFRLMDSSMYHLMDKCSGDPIVTKGVSLHKMIRFFTILTGGDGYLNFMGNEFGHPEWIDFPRKENHWSYDKARRQWSLADNGYLQYQWLLRFDKAMINFVKEYDLFNQNYGYLHHIDEHNKLIIFSKESILFVFCWGEVHSHSNYCFTIGDMGEGSYTPIFNTQDERFGGKDEDLSLSEAYVYTTELKGGNVTLSLPIRPLEAKAYLKL